MHSGYFLSLKTILCSFVLCDKVTEWRAAPRAPLCWLESHQNVTGRLFLTSGCIVWGRNLPTIWRVKVLWLSIGFVSVSLELFCRGQRAECNDILLLSCFGKIWKVKIFVGNKLFKNKPKKPTNKHFLKRESSGGGMHWSWHQQHRQMSLCAVSVLFRQEKCEL